MIHNSSCILCQQSTHVHTIYTTLTMYSTHTIYSPLSSHTIYSLCKDLAKATSEACKASRAENCPFKFLYPLTDSLKTKIETICREMYGAVGVEYTEQAEKRLEVREVLHILLYILYTIYTTVCIVSKQFKRCIVYNSILSNNYSLNILIYLYHTVIHQRWLL